MRRHTKHALQGGGDHIHAGHHAGTAPVGGVVHLMVGERAVGAKVVDRYLHRAGGGGRRDRVLDQKPVERLGDQGEDVDAFHAGSRKRGVTTR